MRIYLLFAFALESCLAFCVPDMPTIESCVRREVTMNDKNWRMVISYFRACRNLGLSMDDIVPQNYMSQLAKRLKTSNCGFIRNTALPKVKVREIEREINELFQEVSILASKEQNLQSIDKTEAKCGPPAPAPTTCSPKPSPQDTAREGEAVDPFDYDDESEISPLSPSFLYMYLLVVALVTLIVTSVTCRYVYKIYKNFEVPPSDEDEAAESLVSSTRLRKTRDSGYKK